jgi:hypothetical protein
MPEERVEFTDPKIGPQIRLPEEIMQNFNLNERAELVGVMFDAYQTKLNELKERKK